jgi:hypothetical protein
MSTVIDRADRQPSGERPIDAALRCFHAFAAFRESAIVGGWLTPY